MSVPIVICDDSSFARKQIARALPSGWDVGITFAANGHECLDALRAGRGDVLFLDLTMPGMDGFDVLERIRAEDLPTLPIVVSGDIQPESQQRVKRLGAVAFIQKPVQATELVEVLDGYGLLELLHKGEAFNVGELDFNDWCQELANVAMGRAANLLAKVIEEGIELSIPRVTLLQESELGMLLNAVGQDGTSVVSQGFIGAGISGETLLFFDDNQAPSLAKLLNYSEQVDDPLEIELLMDLANILVGAFLKGLSEQLDGRFSQGHPQLYLHQGRDVLQAGRPRQQNLAIELDYRIGREQIRCDQLLLFSEDSLQALTHHMEASQS